MCPFRLFVSQEPIRHAPGLTFAAFPQTGAYSRPVGNILPNRSGILLPALGNILPDRLGHSVYVAGSILSVRRRAGNRSLRHRRQNGHIPLRYVMNPQCRNTGIPVCPQRRSSVPAGCQSWALWDASALFIHSVKHRSWYRSDSPPGRRASPARRQDISVRRPLYRR